MGRWSGDCLVWPEGVGEMTEGAASRSRLRAGLCGGLLLSPSYAPWLHALIFSPSRQVAGAMASYPRTS